MNLRFKSLFCLFVIFQFGGFCLFSYSDSAGGENLSHGELSHEEITEERKDIKKRASEEEIKYFFPGGRYEIYITYLTNYENMDDYIDPENIKDMNIVDLEGRLADREDIFERVETEDGQMFKRKTNIEGYKLIREAYWIGRSSTSYCTKVRPDILLKHLILDDNFVSRLYDKNDKVISEYQMRNSEIFPIDYTYTPTTVRNTIKPQGWTRAWLSGMLELPPKDQREGLTYRVVRLDSNRQPKLYFWNLKLGKPSQRYLWEEPLPPYSEYKNWDYYEDEKNEGCYTKSRIGGPDQIILQDSESLPQEGTFPAIVLSGVYDKKSGKFSNGFSVAAMGLPIVSQEEGDIEVLLVEIIKKGVAEESRVISKARVSTEPDVKMETLLKEMGYGGVNSERLLIAAILPVSERYFNTKAGKNLRILVQDTLKEKELFNAPVDWEATLEDFFAKIIGE